MHTAAPQLDAKYSSSFKRYYVGMLYVDGPAPAVGHTSENEAS